MAELDVKDDEAVAALVRRAFERYESGDMDGMLELVHPEAEYRPVFNPGVYRSRKVIRQAFEGFASRRNWSVAELDVHVISGRVFAAARLQTTSTLGSAEDYPVAWVVDVADGLIVRMQSFVHRGQALAAIG